MEKNLIEDDNARKIKELGTRIDFLRNIGFFCFLCSVVMMALVLTLTHVLDMQIKIWLLSVGGCIFLGLAVALFWARKDTTITLFVTFITVFVSGVLLGLSIFSFVTQIKV